MPRRATIHNSIRLVVLLAAGSACTLVAADETPPAAPPAAPAAAATPETPAVETPALRCARHDVTRWTERVAQLRQAAEAATAQVTTAQQALEAAKAAGNTPEDMLKKLMADFETATKAKATADTAVTQAEASTKSAADRLNAFIGNAPKADPATIRQIAKFAHDRILMSCRFDANGDYLYTGTQGNDAYRWNLFTSERQDFRGHQSWVGRVEPLANGQFLTGGYEGRLGLWDGVTYTGQPVRMADAHQGHLRTLAVSADGRLVATAGNDQVVKVWNLADGALVHTLPGHTSHIYSVAFDRAGESLFSGDLMGVIKQWNLTDGKHIRDLDAGTLHKFDTGFVAHVGGVRSMEVSPDGKSLVAVGVGNVSNAFAGIGDPALLHFNLEDGKVLKTFTIPGKNQGSMWAVHWHPSGEFVMAAGWPGFLWFWKPGEDKPFFEFKLPASTYDCCFHPDGLRLAAALYDKSVVVYDIGPKTDPMPAAAAPAAPAAK